MYNNNKIPDTKMAPIQELLVLCICQKSLKLLGLLLWYAAHCPSWTWVDDAIFNTQPLTDTRTRKL